jgi:hypothetical protein
VINQDGMSPLGEVGKQNKTKKLPTNTIAEKEREQKTAICRRGSGNNIRDFFPIIVDFAASVF